MFSGTESDLGQKIIDLRKQGFSYTEIAKKLNCSKSTVSYHCRQSSRDKTKERGIKNKALCP
jgi:orotate phosphoribosyltransferase-like protein